MIYHGHEADHTYLNMVIRRRPLSYSASSSHTSRHHGNRVKFRKSRKPSRKCRNPNQRNRSLIAVPLASSTPPDRHCWKHVREGNGWLASK